MAKTKDPKTLRELRKERRMTQTEVAEGSGVKFSTYTSLEYGYRSPSLSAAQKLATFYGLKVEDIKFEKKERTEDGK